jgi:hypothetical protein
LPALPGEVGILNRGADESVAVKRSRQIFGDRAAVNISTGVSNRKFPTGCGAIYGVRLPRLIAAASPTPAIPAVLERICGQVFS